VGVEVRLEVELVLRLLHGVLLLEVLRKQIEQRAYIEFETKIQTL
jgi:hypothetical protein